MQINFFKREVICKIVYYGPGMSGKTTNLQQINEKTPVDLRSNLTSIATEGERTLFFDYMPLNLGTVGDMNTKFQLYTVPGQVYYNATRKLVLQGTDGVVFVADSQNDKLNENIESLQNLVDNLKEYGISIKDIPLVIQWNKRDLPNALDIEYLEKNINKYNVPSTEAVAAIGEGVVETLKLISSLVLANLTQKQSTTISVTQKQSTTTSITQQQSRAASPTLKQRTTASPSPQPSKTTLLHRVRQVGQRYLGWMRRKEKILATIDDVNINKSYMINFYNLQVRMNAKSPVEDNYDNLSQSEKKDYLDQLINHYLLLGESKKIGITISNQEVDKYLNLYVNKYGSEEKYKTYLAQRKLKLEDIKNEIIKQIIINKIIKIKIPNFQEKLKVDENELLDYYKTNLKKVNVPFESQKKEIEQALTKHKKSKLNQELFQILRSKNTIKTYPENL